MGKEKKIDIKLDEIAQLQDQLKGTADYLFAFQILLKSKLTNPIYETHDGEQKLVVDLPVKIMPSKNDLPNLVIISQAIIFKKPVGIYLVNGYPPNSTIKQFLMLRSVFESECSIIILAKRLELQYCTFQNFKLVNSEIDYLSLEKSKIQGVAEFSGKGNNNVLTTCNFTETEFNGEAKFKKLTFRGVADFKKSILTNSNFSFARFMCEADFKLASFYGESTFKYTQFNDRGAFWGCYFEENPVFHNLILGKDSHIYFGQLNRIQEKEDETDEQYKERKKKEELEIRISKFTLRDTIINGRLDFNNDNIDCLDIKGSVVAGTLSRVSFNPKCDNWQTAVFLKNEAIKRSNTIEALEYKAIEKEKYRIELKENKSIRNCEERFSLWLSRISNNHGQSWLRAVGFTLFVLFIFFGVFYAPSEISIRVVTETLCNKEFYASLVDYFSPINYTILKEYILFSKVNLFVKICGIFIFILGKILTAYGVYEVVQAFRKFNSKGN